MWSDKLDQRFCILLVISYDASWALFRRVVVLYSVNTKYVVRRYRTICSSVVRDCSCDDWVWHQRIYIPDSLRRCCAFLKIGLLELKTTCAAGPQSKVLVMSCALDFSATVTLNNFWLHVLNVVKPNVILAWRMCFVLGRTFCSGLLRFLLTVVSSFALQLVLLLHPGCVEVNNYLIRGGNPCF